MAGNILTPSSLWADFSINKIPSAVVDAEKKKGDVLISHLRIQGRSTKGGDVSIAGVMVRNAEQSNAPGILLVQDFSDGLDETFATYLAGKGYTVLLIDVAGKEDDKQFYTVYPQDVSYANYQSVKDSLYQFEGSAKESCWYEWFCVARYALAYFDSLPFVSQIGGVGIGEASPIMWQTAAIDKNLSCAVFALNAGWNIYRGYNKFGTQEIPQFSDDVMKVLAGIEPQSYAPHIHCPSLTVVALNHDKFDSDRAYDTVSRIPESTYSALYYSPATDGFIGEQGCENILLFLKEFLVKGNSLAMNMPFGVGIKSELKDGKIIVEVTPDPQGLERVWLFVSEGEETPALRAWTRTEKFLEKDGDTYKFEYTPYHKSNIALFFASVEYKNGFCISSNIISKRFSEEEVKSGYKSAVKYSSRYENAESVFFAKNTFDLKPTGIDLKNKNKVFVKNGTMGIEGAGCASGLASFTVNSIKYKPNDDAILMLDVMARKQSILTVKLVTDYYGNRMEYIAKAQINGAKAWNNIKIERTSFKSEQGMVLKSYQKIQAIEFHSPESFLVNNILWI